VERNFSYAIARAFAGHTGKNDAGTTSTYVRADIEEVALALAALVGEPHPLGTRAYDTNSDASAGRLLLALEGN
jgi:integrase/recombinase XerC